jgi:hypothetical protein
MGNIVSIAIFPNGEPTRKHCFLAMFPKGGQARKHCFLKVTTFGKHGWANIVSKGLIPRALFLGEIFRLFLLNCEQSSRNNLFE